MNIKKYYKIFFIIVSSYLVQAHGMGQARKAFLKKWFGRAATLTNCAIAAGPLWYYGAKIIHSSNQIPSSSTLPDASPQTRKFVYKQLQDMGVKSTTIGVKLDNSAPIVGAATDGKNVVIGAKPGKGVDSHITVTRTGLFHDKIAYLFDYREKYKTLLQEISTQKQQTQGMANIANVTRSKNSKLLTKSVSELESLEKETSNLLREIQEEIDLFAFSIQHEAVHIKNKDLIQIGACCLGAPLLMNVAFRAPILAISALRATRKVQQAASATPSVLYSATKIAVAPIQLSMSIDLVNFARRFVEQRADDGTQNTAAHIQAFANFLKKESTHLKDKALLELEVERVASPNSNPISKGEVAKHAQALWLKLDPTHPSPMDRLSKLEERLAKLKNSSK